MKIKLNVTLFGALVILALAAAAYFAIPYCIADAASTTDIGPRAFPQLICVFAAIASALQIVLALMGKIPVVYREISFEKYGKVLLAMALALVTAVLSNYISVVVLAMICSALYLIIFRVKDWRGYAAVVVTGGLLYALMKFVLHIRF